MKPRRIARVAWVLMGVLVKINDVLTNIVANLLQDQLGAYARLIVIPSYFIILLALVVFEVWDQLKARQNRRLALDRRNRQDMLASVRTRVADILEHTLVDEVLSGLDFIDLDLAERAASVVRPLDLLVQ